MDNRFRPWRAILFVLLTLGLLAFTYFLVFRIDFGGSVKVTVRSTKRLKKGQKMTLKVRVSNTIKIVVLKAR